MARKIIHVGNWKMHKNSKESVLFMNEFSKKLKKKKPNSEIVIAAPFTCLSALQRFQSIKLAAQNMHHEISGAYTGQVSVQMIKEFCTHVILGHSEVRALGESNQEINKKVKLAIKYKLTPIICIGENIQERREKKTKDVVEHQIRSCLEGVEPPGFVIAYEPLWAISKGDEKKKSADPYQIDEAISFIRHMLVKLYNENVAQSIRIIYGGSVKQENIKEIMMIQEVDGTLSGNASLDPDKFYNICLEVK